MVKLVVYLFPPLCLLEQNDNTEDVEYRFISRIINILNNILNWRFSVKYILLILL